MGSFKGRTEWFKCNEDENKRWEDGSERIKSWDKRERSLNSANQRVNIDRYASIARQRKAIQIKREEAWTRLREIRQITRADSLRLVRNWKAKGFYQKWAWLNSLRKIRNREQEIFIRNVHSWY